MITDEYLYLDLLGEAMGGCIQIPSPVPFTLFKKLNDRTQNTPS
jgi:hypothetical protein